MQDRELMELAAKSVGQELVWHTDWNEIPYCCRKNHIYNGIWEPLVCGEQALELAVDLRLNIELTKRTVLVYQDGTNPSEGVINLLSADPYESVRLAIVLAAAEIGKVMK